MQHKPRRHARQVVEQLKAVELAEWILEDKLRVRFQTQLHKQLWQDAAGH